MSSVSSFSTHADADMTLSEYFEAFDWSEELDQSGNGDELQLPAEEDHDVYTLDESNLRSSSKKNNNAASSPWTQVASSESQNEHGKVYEEYQKQVDLEILYQNAMIAHLQSKQISKRSQAVFSGVPSIEIQPGNREQQEKLWNLEWTPTIKNDEQHKMHGTMHDSTPTIFHLKHELDTQTICHNEPNRVHQEVKQQSQESYELSPRSSQGKRSSLPCSTTVHKRRFALSFTDGASTSQPSIPTRRSKSKSSGPEMIKKDALNTIKDLQRNRKKRNNSYTERKGVSSIRVEQDPQTSEEKLKATCDQEVLLDSHTPILAEELNQLEEHIQEKYAESERELLRLFLEDDVDVIDVSSQQTPMDILEEQFKRAIIAHQESKEKSKQTFFLTQSTSLHQESLIKYTKDRSQFQTSIQPMQQVNDFSNPHTHLNELDVKSLQPINTASSLLNTSRLGLSHELDPCDRSRLHIEQGRSEEHQQHYDYQTELRYRTNMALSQISTDLCQQPMLDQNFNVGGSSSTSMQLIHEPKSPIGQQVTLQKRQVTLESIRAVEDLVSGRRSSLTKELEDSRRLLRDFLRRRK